MNPERRIIESSHALACGLPGGTVEALASAILARPADSLRAEIARRIAHHQHRDLALAFVDRGREEAGGLDARTVAVALPTAAHAERAHRDSKSVEPVWTGPDAGVVPFRRTEQAILQVIDAARTRITLVSFAVYRIPNVARSLVKAASRGVRLTIDLETPDRIEGQGSTARSGRSAGRWRAAPPCITGPPRIAPSARTARPASSTSNAPWRTASGCSSRRPT